MKPIYAHDQILVFGYTKGMLTQQVYVCSGWAGRVHEVNVGDDWILVNLVGADELLRCHIKQCEPLEKEEA